MSGKWCNEGETWTLEKALETADLYIGLYTETTEPAEGATLANVTEPVAAGYVRVLIQNSPSDWTIVGDTATGTLAVFTATGVWGNVYGYFIATSVGGTGKLLAVEHFTDGPYDVQDNGDQVKVTPSITCA
jgi:hypothetical protein